MDPAHGTAAVKDTAGTNKQTDRRTEHRGEERHKAKEEKRK